MNKINLYYNKMNYPQSSCPCVECKAPGSYLYNHEPNKGTVPCSLAMSGCKLPTDLAYCTSKQIYNQNIQPSCTPYTQFNLNKLGVTLETDKYRRVEPSGINSKQCQSAYLGSNPKLVEPVRAQPLLLDRPNYTGHVPVGNVPHDEIYTPFFSKYGKGYTNYSDITGGQIQYYVTTDNANAYYPPNFVTPALVNHELHVNPMGIVYPQYNRIPLDSYGWDKCHKDQCDSSTHDALQFRQGLMERQMRTINQQRYEPRWARAALSSGTAVQVPTV